MSDHLLAIWGFVGTFLFGILSLTLAWLTLRSRRMAWGGYSETISTSGAEGQLTIKFGERTFSEVHITRIFVWNARRQSITGNDISKTDPLRLSLSEGSEILATAITDMTSPSVDAKILLDETDRRTALLTFDILNKGQGFAARILHRGSSIDMSITGTLKDVLPIVELPLESAARSSRYATSRRIRVGAAFLVVAFGSILIALATMMIGGMEHYLENLRISMFFLAGGITLLVVLVSFGFLWVPQIPHSLNVAVNENGSDRLQQ